jgi:hypothetical protein
MINTKGQGESLIKMLVIAIIAIIALALAKSYFRESGRVAQRTVEDIFSPVESLIISVPILANFELNTIPHYQDEK